MGWRFGLVTGVFLSVTKSLSVIRNSINPLDYAAGGLAMGAVYRFNMGPRGMVGAGMAGAIYGLRGRPLTEGCQRPGFGAGDKKE